MKKLFFPWLLLGVCICGAVEIRTVPGFNTSSFYIKAQEGEISSLSYRKVNGKEFQQVFPPIYDAGKKEYRGSIVHLNENTRYELKAVCRDGKSKSKIFRTRSSSLQAAKTIVLDAKNFSGTLKISDVGRPDGYVRYTCAPGFVLKNDGTKPLIELDKAQYVILENMVLQGGNQHAVTVYNCKNIHISNCEISGWGRRGVQRFDIDGKFYSDYGPQKPYKDCFNYDSAIEVKWCNTVTVEKCYIHDPVFNANSWFYSHPTGPCAMTVAKCKRVVIRYNDFAGSDKNRWNDAVEGPGNFHPAGGLGFDADIYGNYMAFSNDDGIEIDGGQANVRCFHNKFEQTFCGVSVQGCMTGPGYVFENVLTYISDVQGCGNQAIKTNSDKAGKYAVSFLFNNSIYSPEETELKLQSSWPVVAVNNIYAGISTLTKLTNAKGSTENNTFSIKTDAAGKNDIFTAEKIFESVSDGQLFVSSGSSAKASGKVTALLDKKASPLPFKVRINSDFDWLKVFPASGVLKPGEKFTFSVSIDREAAKNSRFLRGVFFIRTDDGLSRPVSVYAKGITQNITRPAVAKGKFVHFFELGNPVSGTLPATAADNLAEGGKCFDFTAPKAKDGSYIVNPVKYNFDVPADGFYTVLVRVKSSFPRKSHNSIFAAIDDEKMQNTDLMTVRLNAWNWQICKRKGPCPTGVFLKKGRHTLTVAPRESLLLDLIAVTNDPAAFEVW